MSIVLCGADSTDGCLCTGPGADDALPQVPRTDQHQALQQLLPQHHEGLSGTTRWAQRCLEPVYWWVAWTSDKYSISKHIRFSDPWLKLFGAFHTLFNLYFYFIPSYKQYKFYQPVTEKTAAGVLVLILPLPWHPMSRNSFYWVLSGVTDILLANIDEVAVLCLVYL